MADPEEMDLTQMNVAELESAARSCTGCELHEDATQVVFDRCSGYGSDHKRSEVYVTDVVKHFRFRAGMARDGYIRNRRASASRRAGSG